MPQAAPIKRVNQRTAPESPGRALERTTRLNAQYARAVQNKVFTFGGAGLVGLLSINTLVISWNLRVVLSLLVAASLAYTLRQALETAAKDFAWHDSELRREELAHPPLADLKNDRHARASDLPKDGTAPTEYEGAEWLNALMDVMWPVLDQQLFATAQDLIEDELKALTPSVVQTVRVTSLEQGVHPVRILGMRILPSSAKHSSFVPESVPDGDANRHDRDQTETYSSWTDPSIPEPAPFAADQDEQRAGAEQLRAEDEDGAQGPYVEMEVDFGYRRALSSQDADGSDAAQGKVAPEDVDQHIHFVAYLTVGVHKVTGFPVPILFAVQSIRGKARVRLQFIPEPPFVKTVTFALEGYPQVEVNAYPLRGPLDVLSVPFIKQYGQSAIEAAMAKFVRPRHYALDVRKFMFGGDVPMKTRTIGLVVIVLHSAAHLPAADPRLSTIRHKGGKSDPYVEVSWSALGKSLYRSQVKRNTPEGGEARWEEMCFVRCPREPIEDNSKLRFSVWDDDRFRENDLVGFAEIPIRTIHEKPGEWRRETARLNINEADVHHHRASRDEDGQIIPATLEYSIAFFPLLERARQAEAEKKAPTRKPADDPARHPLAPEAVNERAFESDQLHEDRKAARLDSLKEMLNGRHPPTLGHRSGILSFMVHSVADIQLEKGAGAVKAAMRRLKPGTQTKAMRRAELPSAYVMTLWNDQLIHRTRLAPFSSSPSFGGGSETFIRDWTLANMTFAVMDYRDRDRDVLIGYASLNLRDVFRDHCQVSKWYPISGGAGSGRLRLSLLFKPLAIHVHRSLREWSVGALQVVSASIVGVNERNFTGVLRLNIDEGRSATRPVMDRQNDDDSDRLDFDFSSGPIVLPVLSRITPVQVALVGMGMSSMTSSRKALAEGVFSLNKVMRDPAEQTIEIVLDRNGPPPMPSPYPLPRLQIEDDQNDGDDEEDSMLKRPPQKSEVRSDRRDDSLILRLCARWRPGMSTTHADLVLSEGSSARAAYDVYLHKKDHEASLAGERGTDQPHSKEEQDTDAGSGQADGAGWEDELDERGQVEEIENKKDGTRTRKGGTFRWLKQGARVAGRRIQGIKHHRLGELQPETEMQSAL